MGYLRLVRSAAAAPAAGNDCLEAFERELDYLYAMLQRFGAAPGDIDDLLQEIFLVLHRQWPRLDVTRPLRPWLFGVTFRVVRAQRRKRLREGLRQGLFVAVEDEPPGPDVRLEEHESLGLLRSAMECVPAPRRAVVVMHDIEGLEIAAIARRLGMSKIGVYSRLYKGRRELAAAVRRLGRRRA